MVWIERLRSIDSVLERTWAYLENATGFITVDLGAFWIGRKSSEFFMFRMCSIFFSFSILRWGNRPIDEATNFGHTQVIEYLNNLAEAKKTEQKNKGDQQAVNNDNNNDNKNVTSETEAEETSKKNAAAADQPPLP